MNVRNMTNDQLETLAEFAYNLAEERAAREKLARRVSELQADFVEVLCRLNRVLDADFDDVVEAVAAVETSGELGAWQKDVEHARGYRDGVMSAQRSAAELEADRAKGLRLLNQALVADFADVATAAAAAVAALEAERVCRGGDER